MPTTYSTKLQMRLLRLTSFSINCRHNIWYNLSIVFSQKFCEEDIESILQNRATVLQRSAGIDEESAVFF